MADDHGYSAAQGPDDLKRVVQDLYERRERDRAEGKAAAEPRHPTGIRNPKK